jgi:hypothetical protein
MAIEAAALTGAMSVLRSRGILALPMHDGLLVPVTGAGYVGGALDSAYSYFAKVPKVTPLLACPVRDCGRALGTVWRVRGPERAGPAGVRNRPYL